MNDTFTLAHLSDCHLASLNRIKMRDLLNKRIYGYLRWQVQRRAAHRQEVLEALFCDLHSTSPDHTVITGDLTHLGLAREFRKVRDLLNSLGSPSDITVIPGNHDAYVRTDWDDTCGILADFMISDEPYRLVAAGTNSRFTFPSLRVRGMAALIGLSSAHPSGPLSAVGTIGREQLQEMEKILAATGAKQLFRIVMVHHPPVPGTVSWRKRLTDGETFRSVVTNHGVELVLHGHTHCSSLRYLETTVGRTPVIGVPSGSALGRRAKTRSRYNLYQVKRNPQGWELVVTVRCYSPPSQDFVEERETHFTLPRPVT
jgi:3',5'-cyclic AMP phosphodiesterase CpdA